jgi:hypothetical protein
MAKRKHENIIPILTRFSSPFVGKIHKKLLTLQVVYTLLIKWKNGYYIGISHVDNLSITMKCRLIPDQVVPTVKKF